MTLELQLPTAQGGRRSVPVRQVSAGGGRKSTGRTAYAAVHVVADPWQTPSGNGQCHWDQEATLAFRHHVWDQGLGVAEAMDTAQRGMGLAWDQAKELIALTLEAARDRDGADVVVGVGTDHLDAEEIHTLGRITEAYLEQLDFVESLGGRTVIMASRALAKTAAGPGDYEKLYCEVLAAVRSPAMLHWLGEAFDPALRGYWGAVDTERAAETVHRIMDDAGPERVAGIKLSLLDQGFETRFRARLGQGQAVFTGDDFNYPQLIAGADGRFSHALLGIFDPLAPLAGEALRCLDAADSAGFHAILDPTVPLARHLFAAPTQYYKVGVVFLAWLNGHQSHFRMIGGLQGQRSLSHLVTLAGLAAGCGALTAPELAQERLDALFRVAGVA
ncbi:MAG: DUF993 family protein [Alphaproteobacteria bacterium]